MNFIRNYLRCASKSALPVVMVLFFSITMLTISSDLDVEGVMKRLNLLQGGVVGWMFVVGINALFTTKSDT